MRKIYVNDLDIVVSLLKRFQDHRRTRPARLDDLSGLITEQNAIDQVNRLIQFVGAWMSEKQYYRGLACLDLAVQKKCVVHGQVLKPLFRQDQKTPSIIHELTQAVYTIALHESGYKLPCVETALCLNFLHDLGEEFNVTEKNVLDHFDSQGLGLTGDNVILADHFESLTKSRIDAEGKSIPKFGTSREYFLPLLEDPRRVIAKLQDRIHNNATLIGVKRGQKLRDYILETEELRDTLYPAIRLYHEYAPVLRVLDEILKTQILFNTLYYNLTNPDTPLPASPIRKMSLYGVPGIPSGIDPLLMPQERARSTGFRINVKDAPRLVLA